MKTFKHKKINIYNVDCLEFFKSIPNKYYDLVVSDPPYFSGPEKRGFYGSKIPKIKVKRIDYPITEVWELPSENWFNEIKRISKNQIIWGANYFNFIGKTFKTPRGKEIDGFIKSNPKGWIIWDKCNGENSFNDYELAWTSFDKPTIIFKFLWNGMMQGLSIENGHIMQGNKKLNQKKIHPTEKPILLYDWLHKNFTEENFKVLSSHLGSGSDALSALKFNFQFDGCEISSIHFNNAIERIKLIESQQKIIFNFF